MHIKDQERNGFRRTASPSETIKTVKDGLQRLELKEEIKIMKSSDHLWSVRLEIPTLRAGVNGKGISEQLAIASAYGEMAERLSAGMEIGIEVGPFRQLFGTTGDAMAKVTLYKYMKGYRWTHQDSIQNSVAVEDFCKRNPFTNEEYHNMKMNSELLKHWVPGYSLVQKKNIYIPILFTKWISSTNGLAAGNTIEEAIVQGCCEIFERDAMIDFLLGKTPLENCPVINLTTIDNPIIKQHIEFFHNNHVEVVIRDIGNSIYPVYTILTYNHDMPENYIGYNNIKAGSSFDSNEAIMRCFTERMQGTDFEFEESQGPRPEGLNHDQYMSAFFKGICPMDLKTHGVGTSVPYKSYSETNIVTEINNCVEIAKKLDTDIIVVDHTHPIINFPTARVIMPGVSDFMKWWAPSTLTSQFVGNLQPEEDKYEKKLISVLESFFKKKPRKQDHGGVITCTED